MGPRNHGVYICTTWRIRWNDPCMWQWVFCKITLAICYASTHRIGSGAVGSMFLVLLSFFAYICLCACASEWAHSPTVDFSYFYFSVAVTSKHVKID